MTLRHWLILESNSVGKCTFVIPMAGRGSRFAQRGYQMPKWRIEVRGKSLLEWSVDSLPLDQCGKLIFVGLKEHQPRYSLTTYVEQRYADLAEVRVILLNEVTRGQAETVLMAKDEIDTDAGLLIFNSDTRFSSSTLRENLNRRDVDGVIGAFTSSAERFSYARLNEGFVVETAEKKVISPHALTGLYHFSSARDFIRVAEARVASGVMDKGEFYVAPLYNDIIASGRNRFIIDTASSIDILGTPEEVESFEKCPVAMPSEV